MKEKGNRKIQLKGRKKRNERIKWQGKSKVKNVKV